MLCNIFTIITYITHNLYYAVIFVYIINISINISIVTVLLILILICTQKEKCIYYQIIIMR